MIIPPTILCIAAASPVLWILHRIYFPNLTVPDAYNPWLILERFAFRHKSSVIEYLRRMGTTLLVPDRMRVIANCPEGMTDGFYQLTVLWALGAIFVVIIAIDCHISMYLSSRPVEKRTVLDSFAYFIAMVLYMYPAGWWFVAAFHREQLERAHAKTSGLAGVAGRPPVELRGGVADAPESHLQ
ncbi:hypothetical protein K456DRAFT_32779 [Colletotrichum gloeosporioides 23]|nr:hypothetical protein K456DRAFT_32779 [Colletotrichum gloeosporioides 23]